MADIDNGTLAIIVISVALGVTLIILLICLIIFCRLRIQDDTNIRKRVLARHYTQGYMAQDQVKVTETLEEEVPMPMPMPVPVPQAMPLPRREIYREPEPPLPPPPPPPPPPQPEIIVHEVVHRYQPTQPAVIYTPPTAPSLPELPPQRIVRRSSWCAPQDDEWVMIKKTKKKKGRKSRYEDSDSSDDSDEEEVYTRKRHGYARGLAHYDLAVPMPMGGANFVMGARPMMATPVMMAPMTGAVSGIPVMTAAPATFQPTYGVVPMM